MTESTKTSTSSGGPSLRLVRALDPRSGLAAPLSAYAVDHAGTLRFEEVDAIRAEYGIAPDPPAEELMLLLPLDEIWGA